VELEYYKCKFCPTEILSGFRCYECYLKKVGNNPDKGEKPYIVKPLLVPQREYDGPFTIRTTTGTTSIAVSEEAALAGLNNFTSGGNATNGQICFTTSDSTNMGVNLRANAYNLEDSL